MFNKDFLRILKLSYHWDEIDSFVKQTLSEVRCVVYSRWSHRAVLTLSLRRNCLHHPGLCLSSWWGLCGS